MMYIKYDTIDLDMGCHWPLLINVASGKNNK